MSDLEFIKAISGISLSKICKEVGVDRSNLLNNRVSAESINKVKVVLMERLNELGLVDVSKRELNRKKEPLE